MKKEKISSEIQNIDRVLILSPIFTRIGVLKIWGSIPPL